MILNDPRRVGQLCMPVSFLRFAPEKRHTARGVRVPSSVERGAWAWNVCTPSGKVHDARRRIDNVRSTPVHLPRGRDAAVGKLREPGELLVHVEHEGAVDVERVAHLQRHLQGREDAVLLVDEAVAIRLPRRLVLASHVAAAARKPGKERRVAKRTLQLAKAVGRALAHHKTQKRVGSDI